MTRSTKPVNSTSLAYMFASLAVFFDRTGQPEIAATMYGTTTRRPTADQVVGFASAVYHLRHLLDAETLDGCVNTGKAMNLTEAVHYALHHINITPQNQT